MKFPSVPFLRPPTAQELTKWETGVHPKTSGWLRQFSDSIRTLFSGGRKLAASAGALPFAAAERTTNVVASILAAPSSLLFYPIGKVFNATRGKIYKLLAGKEGSKAAFAES